MQDMLDRINEHTILTYKPTAVQISPSVLIRQKSLLSLSVRPEIDIS